MDSILVFEGFVIFAGTFIFPAEEAEERVNCCGEAL